MKIKSLIAIAAIGFSSQACSIKAPGYISDSAKVSQMATPDKFFKSATTCAYAPLFFYPSVIGFHDTVQIMKEANKAGIDKIAFIQEEATSYVLFTKYCMTAYGN